MRNLIFMRKHFVALVSCFLLAVTNNYASADLVNPFNVGVPDELVQYGSKVTYVTNFGCPYDLIKPVTQDLIIGSKYEQSDSTKSTLKTDGVTGSEIKNAVNNFLENISKYSDYAIFASSEKRRIVALKCIVDNLENWASAGALVDVETTGNGEAVRKWLLASVSSSILKLQSVYPNLKLSDNIKGWLSDMSMNVYDYYNTRYLSRTKWFNNHDNWAAFSVALASIITNNDKGIIWAKEIFEYSLSLAKEEKNTGNLYFEIEVGRGYLGAEYMNFSMIPLIFMADCLRINGLLSKSDWEKLQLLARFTKDITLHPEKLSLNLEEQKKVGKHMTIWILPYKRLMDNLGVDSYASKIVSSELDTTGTYSLVGGNLKVFYP